MTKEERKQLEDFNCCDLNGLSAEDWSKFMHLIEKRIIEEEVVIPRRVIVD